MATVNNKFTKNLTASFKELRGQRATLLSASAEDAQSELIRDLKKKQRDYQTRLLSLEDLGPDCTTSLKITPKEFNAESWVRELHNAKLQLALIEQELKIAEDTYKEFFGV